MLSQLQFSRLSLAGELTGTKPPKPAAGQSDMWGNAKPTSKPISQTGAWRLGEAEQHAQGYMVSNQSPD